MADPGSLDAVLDALDRDDDLVQQARESLEETLGGLRLTPEEERALAGEIGQLRELARKLDEKTIEIASAVRNHNGRRWIRVSVRDNGIGIRPENLAKIFTPFYTSKEATRGTGLGLSVSLGIAESHNGTIEVESTLGQGSLFRIALPPFSELSPKAPAAPYAPSS